MAANKLKTASVLAFERKHANSDGFMYSGIWANRSDSEQWEAIRVETKDVRGTISNRLKTAIANDPLKLDAEIQKANLQRVDTAALPVNHDTLKVTFTLRVLGGLSTPSACNSKDYQEALSAVIEDYAKREGFSELAKRYAENLANGRFLWRNRVGAEAVEVRISQLVDDQVAQSWVFDSHNFNLRNFGNNEAALKPLSDLVQQGLAGDKFVLLKIEAFAKLGDGQEVFPSQELVLDGGRDSAKSKYLYSVNDVAAMHSQKIGNALRSIDTWYSEAETYGPIAVEPYGSVTSRGSAYRQPKDKEDFYSLLDSWVLKGNVPTIGNQHYVMATLIRGGVFGEAG
ncbi:type I-F CRISPR-associated protein Csy3 [Thalassolituus sp. UBA3500]|uniref:type I-F CRISPR-associated protein Csy3 n=1 Tax=Thalassolituus sp. UBA3500 TaxID=1947664 RepID=UPI000C0CB624|nr:type I-F CRISPR-associated protein Csy3 [Thalassolituus sp. UBA3500]MBN58778.1 type I-F CRISPR-associated protein Csy3 [Oceanospirillaceae bacterium]